MKINDTLGEMVEDIENKRGDLSVRFEFTRNDEIGRTAKSIKRTLKSLPETQLLWASFQDLPTFSLLQTKASQ